jgi:hypothetical protein
MGLALLVCPLSHSSLDFCRDAAKNRRAGLTHQEACPLAALFVTTARYLSLLRKRIIGNLASAQENLGRPNEEIV